MDTSFSGVPRAGRDREEQGALRKNGQLADEPFPGRFCSFEERLFCLLRLPADVGQHQP
jgi:hypothetical protein